MSRCCFVTALDDATPFEWGWQLDRVAVPMVLFCSPDIADTLRRRDLPSHVTLITAELPQPPSLRHKIASLRDACRLGHHDADSYYWVDVRMIYMHLSFEYLYGDLFAEAIRRFTSGPAYFIMPGYEADSCFGGPRSVIEALDDTLDDPFDRGSSSPSPDPVFLSAFDDLRPPDLNLKLGAAIKTPVLHVIGDSHVLNCFTLNASIGCRPNVLVRTADVSDTPVPYAYHFSHHLGSRTMHFAGRPGTLLGVANECSVKAGDAIAWVFGEIDVRCHIVRQRDERGRTLGEVVDTLANDYVREVLGVQRAHDGVRSVIVAPIPPLDNPGYTSDDFPVYGAIEARIEATRRLRAVLAALCVRHRLLFLNVGTKYESPRGDLRWELSDHFCHIGSGCQRPALEGLYDVLAGGVQAVAAGG